MFTEFTCENCGAHVDDPTELLQCERCFRECCVNCIIALISDIDLCDECAGLESVG